MPQDCGARDMRFLTVVAVLVIAAGCDSGLPKVYPVTGKVVSKGKGLVKDLAGYNVQFQSLTDPKELPGGVIAEDGSFTVAFISSAYPPAALIED